MKPLLKWPGGKRRELDKLLPFVPDKFNRYFEPFFGGGAMFFHLQPKKAVLSDIYKPLIRFYSEVAFSFDELKCGLGVLHARWTANQKQYVYAKSQSPDEVVENPNAVLYNRIRALFNYDGFGVRGLMQRLGEEPDPDIDNLPFGAGFWFLNHTAYGGMMRFNSDGFFNVPFGHYKTLNTSSVTREYSKLLRRSADLFCGSYENAFRKVQPNDFVFLDPPYDTTFSQYGADAPFGTYDHRLLATLFIELPCKALLVINKTPLTESLYHDYIKTSYSYTYNSNIKNRYSRQTEHLVICNY